MIFSFQSTIRKYRKRITKIEEKAKPLFNLPGIDYEEALTQMPEHIQQVKYLQNFAGFPIYTDNKTKYLSPGEKKFERLLEELRKAEKYIFLEYFIVQEGIMWNAILDVLKEKVKQGVCVRIMYDDIGSFLLLPKDYPKKMKKLGIDCVIFNPFRPVLTVVQNNRDHRKIAIIRWKGCIYGRYKPLGRIHKCH